METLAAEVTWASVGKLVNREKSHKKGKLPRLSIGHCGEKSAALNDALKGQRSAKCIKSLGVSEPRNQSNATIT
jgi:hypothetical protein